MKTRIAGYDDLDRLQYEAINPKGDLDDEREAVAAAYPHLRIESELETRDGWVRYSPAAAAESMRAWRDRDVTA